MNIILLVKQVTDTKKLKLKAGERFDIENYDLPRIINVFDKYAIEEAARIKDRNPKTNITVLSFGEMSAERTIVEAMSICADRGYLINDSSLKGSDSLASAKIIKAAIKLTDEKNGKTDLILMGSQSIDSGTSQLGVMLSELMGYGYISNAADVMTEEGTFGSSLTVRKRTSDEYIWEKMELPSVVTVTKNEHSLRLPTFQRIRWANREEVQVLNAEDLRGFGFNKSSSGMRLISVRKPGRNTKNAIIYPEKRPDLREQEKENLEAVQKLIGMLDEDKILKR